jgi:hypothetical protein
MGTPVRTGNADHIARMVRAALRDHLRSSGERVRVTDVDYSDGSGKPCFWVEIDGETVIVECSLWGAV